MKVNVPSYFYHLAISLASEGRESYDFILNRSIRGYRINIKNRLRYLRSCTQAKLLKCRRKRRRIIVSLPRTPELRITSNDIDVINLATITAYFDIWDEHSPLVKFLCSLNHLPDELLLEALSAPPRDVRRQIEDVKVRLIRQLVDMSIEALVIHDGTTTAGAVIVEACREAGVKTICVQHGVGYSRNHIAILPSIVDFELTWLPGCAQKYNKLNAKENFLHLGYPKMYPNVCDQVGRQTLFLVPASHDFDLSFDLSKENIRSCIEQHGFEIETTKLRLHPAETVETRNKLLSWGFEISTNREDIDIGVSHTIFGYPSTFLITAAVNGRNTFYIGERNNLYDELNMVRHYKMEAGLDTINLSAFTGEHLAGFVLEKIS